MSLPRRFMLASGLGLGAASFAGPVAAQRGRDTAGAGAAGGAPTAAALNAGALATDLGIVPDSSADQTAALQRVIDQAAARRVALHLPAGRYNAGSLTLRRGSRITGAGAATVLAVVAIAAKGANGLHLDGLAIEGRGAAAREPDRTPLLAIADSRDVTFTHLTVRRAAGTGIALTGVGGCIDGCLVEHCVTGLHCLDAQGLEIAGNTVRDCADNGILVWRSRAGEDGTLIAGNRIERIAAKSGGSGQNGNGINVYRAGAVQVSGNHISDCAFTAIRGNAASDLQMTGNTCLRLGEVALYAEFAFEGVVIASNLVDRAALGISVTNFNEGGRLAVVQGNLVRNLALRHGDPEPRGIGISVEADAAVTGNVIEGAPALGLMIGWGRYLRDIVASGNLVRGAGIGIGIQNDPAAGRVLLANNLVSGSRDGAIRAMSHDKPVGPDLARSASAAPAHVTLAGNTAV